MPKELDREHKIQIIYNDCHDQKLKSSLKNNAQRGDEISNSVNVFKKKKQWTENNI